MAAIDKLYVNDYYEYDSIRKWAIIYYPKLFVYMYDAFISWDDFTKKRPAMNTPLNVDRKLKWICPIPVVREYLHEQCGVNPKWEWLYKIFWRGKKYFL